jgi:hypothetical protein
MYRPCDPCAVRRCSQFLIGTSRYNFQDLAVSHNGDCVQLRSDIGRPSLTETSRGRAVTGSAAISVFSPRFWFIEPTSVSPRRDRTAAPDDRDRGPSAQAREGGGDRPSLRSSALSQDHGCRWDYDDLAEANRRHRSLRQYHDHRRPMTPASLALASWRLRPRNW